MNDETLNISTLQTELAETEAAKLETEAHLRDANEKIKSLEAELIQVKQRVKDLQQELEHVSTATDISTTNVKALTTEKEALEKELAQVKASRLDLETTLEHAQTLHKGASLTVGKNAHDILDLQATLEAEKETNELLQPVADAVYQHICTQLAGDYGLKGLPTAIRLFSEAYTEQKEILEGYKEAAANVDETYQSDLSHAEGLHARCEEEKKHLDAKYQALVKEVAAIEAQPVTDTEALLRQTVEDLTRENRIKHYALEYLMTVYDAECDRIRDLLDIQQELKAALEETTATLEDAQRAARNVKIIDDAIKEVEAANEPA